jgi:hypothetical protein
MSAFEGIVLQKSFWGGDQNFSGPLMPFARGDMRDHIVLHKNDHGASYGRYAVLQWWSRLKISFCEIFGVVQFSTFATLSRVERTCTDPKRTSGPGRSVLSSRKFRKAKLRIISTILAQRNLLRSSPPGPWHLSVKRTPVALPPLKGALHEWLHVFHRRNRP